MKFAEIGGKSRDTRRFSCRRWRKKEEEKFVEARKAKSEEVSRRRLRLWNRACVLEDDGSDREEKNIGRYLWVLFRKSHYNSRAPHASVFVARRGKPSAKPVRGAENSSNRERFCRRQRRMFVRSLKS